MTTLRLPYALLLLALALAGCGGEPAPAPPEAPAAGAAAAEAPLLKADLPGAIPVLTALAGTEGQEVTVVGRLQSKVKGRAMFHIVDESVEDCTKTGEQDHCPTPWDYCCRVKEMKAAIMLVELRGPDGLPLKIASHGVRELDVVVVKGTLAKGEGGALMLLARDGWYLRDRPKVSARVKFPG